MDDWEKEEERRLDPGVDEQTIVVPSKTSLRRTRFRVAALPDWFPAGRRASIFLLAEAREQKNDSVVVADVACRSLARPRSVRVRPFPKNMFFERRRLPAGLIKLWDRRRCISCTRFIALFIDPSFAFYVYLVSVEAAGACCILNRREIRELYRDIKIFEFFISISHIL